MDKYVSTVHTHIHTHTGPVCVEHGTMLRILKRRVLIVWNDLVSEMWTFNSQIYYINPILMKRSYKNLRSTLSQRETLAHIMEWITSI